MPGIILVALGVVTLVCMAIINGVYGGRDE